ISNERDNILPQPLFFRVSLVEQCHVEIVIRHDGPASCRVARGDRFETESVEIARLQFQALEWAQDTIQRSDVHTSDIDLYSECRRIHLLVVYRYGRMIVNLCAGLKFERLGMQTPDLGVEVVKRDGTLFARCLRKFRITDLTFAEPYYGCIDAAVRDQIAYRKIFICGFRIAQAFVTGHVKD